MKIYNSKNKLILSCIIIVLAIMIFTCALYFTLNSNESFIGDEANVVSTAAGTGAVIGSENDESLPDGAVTNAYRADVRNHGYTAISNENQLWNFLGSNSSSSYGYFTTNISFADGGAPGGYFANDLTLNGVLDGNGYTLTMNGTSSPNADNVGGICRTISSSGVIKNMTLDVVQCQITSTRAGDIYAGLFTGNLQGKLINCRLTFRPNGEHPSNSSGSTLYNSNNYKGLMALGGFAGQTSGGSSEIINCTADYKSGSALYCYLQNGNNTQVWPETAGFVAMTNGVTNFKNITLMGNGLLGAGANMNSSSWGTWYSATIRVGGIVAEAKANTIIQGLIYSYNGTMKLYNRRDNGAMGTCVAIVGGGSVTIQGVYYTTSSNYYLGTGRTGTLTSRTTANLGNNNSSGNSITFGNGTDNGSVGAVGTSAGTYGGYVNIDGETISSSNSDRGTIGFANTNGNTSAANSGKLFLSLKSTYSITSTNSGYSIGGNYTSTATLGNLSYETGNLAGAAGVGRQGDVAYCLFDKTTDNGASSSTQVGRGNGNYATLEARASTSTVASNNSDYTNWLSASKVSYSNTHTFSRTYDGANIPSSFMDYRINNAGSISTVSLNNIGNSTTESWNVKFTNNSNTVTNYNKDNSANFTEAGTYVYTSSLNVNSVGYLQSNSAFVVFSPALINRNDTASQGYSNTILNGVSYDSSSNTFTVNVSKSNLQFNARPTITNGDDSVSWVNDGSYSGGYSKDYDGKIVTLGNSSFALSSNSAVYAPSNSAPQVSNAGASGVTEIKNVYKYLGTVQPYIITYSYAGDNNTNAISIQYRIIISPYSINFSTLGNIVKEYKNANYDIEAELNMPVDAPVTLQYYNEGGSLTSDVKNAGIYTVKPIISGSTTSDNYDIAVSADNQVTFVIAPKLVTLHLVKEFTGSGTSHNELYVDAMTASNFKEYILGQDTGIIETDKASVLNSFNLAGKIGIDAGGAGNVGITKWATLFLQGKDWSDTGLNNTKFSSYGITGYYIPGSNYYLADYHLQDNACIVYPKTTNITACTKEYNGNANATVTYFSNLVGSDSLSIAGTFDTANVGLYKTVTINSSVLDTTTYAAYTSATFMTGTNYALGQTSYSGSVIYPKEISVSSVSKVYDGTSSINVTNFTGLVSGQSLTLTANYDNANAGTGKTVTITSSSNISTFSAYIQSKNYLTDTNYCIASKTYTSGVITKATVTATLNDNKMLYDSRMDYNNSDSFDFIYVYDGSNKTLSDSWIDYRTMFALSSSTISNYGSLGITISGFKYFTNSTFATETSSTIGTSGSNTYYYVQLQLDASNDVKNNINMYVNIVNSNGAANGYSNGSLTIGEGAKSNQYIRVLVAKNSIRTGSDTSLATYNNTSAFKNSALYSFMGSRYYDTIDTFGNSITSGFTEYQVSADIKSDLRATVFSILPAYKTIDGQNHAFNSVYQTTSHFYYLNYANGMDGSTAGGGSAQASISLSNSSTPAFIQDYMDLGTWVGASDFVALSYGTIKNITVGLQQVSNKNHEYEGFQNANLSFGIACGINFGTMQNVNATTNSSAYTTMRVKGADGLYDMAMGGLVGINVGVVSCPNNTVYIGSNVFGTQVESGGRAKNSYVGGVAGLNYYGNINFGTVTSANSCRLVSHGYQKSITGGIVGYNVGDFDSSKTRGIVENAKFVNNSGSFLWAGGDYNNIMGDWIDNYGVESFACGGLVGVNNGGSLRNGIVQNNGGIYGGSTNAVYYPSYVGGLLGIGSEEGTVNSNVAYREIAVRNGEFKNCTLFNYNTIASFYGDWGFLTGKYCNLTSLSGFTHEFGGLVWYTTWQATAGVDITLFGTSDTLLGNINAANANNVHITGIAGISFVDGDNGTVAAQYASGSTIVLSGNNISINYSAVSIPNFYSGYVTIVDPNTGKEKEGVTYSQTNQISNNTAKTAIISLNDLDALITDTSAPASRAQIWFNYTVYAGSTELDYFLDSVTSRSDDPQKYKSASRFILKENVTKDVLPRSWVLNSRKTLQGDNQYITYTSTWGTSGTNPAYTTVSFHGDTITRVFGDIVAVNYGTIKNLTLSIVPSNNYHYFYGASGGSTAYGLVAGTNYGQIDNVTVNINSPNGTGLHANAATNAFLGGIAGINQGGHINNCTIYVNQDFSIYNATAGTGYYAVGGVAGISDLGEISGCRVYVGNSGWIRSSSVALESYAGGLVGSTGISTVASQNPYWYSQRTYATTYSNCYVQVMPKAGSNAYTTQDAIVVADTHGGAGILFGRVVDSNAPTNMNNTLTNMWYICGRDLAITQNSGTIGMTVFGYFAASNNIGAKNVNTIVLSDYYAGEGVAPMIRSFTSILDSTNAITKFSAELSAYGTSGTTQYVYFGQDEASEDTISFNFKNDADIYKQNITTGSITADIYSNSTACTITVPSISASSTSSMGYVKIRLSYTVHFQAEDITYDGANSALFSPFLNFIGDMGYVPLYKGARKGILKGSIALDKKISGAREFREGKILDGNGYNINSKWLTSDPEKPADIEGNYTDSASHISVTNNDVNSGYFTKYIDYQGTRYYGVSDLISINRGTIRGINVSFENSTVAPHTTRLLNANTVYGTIAGINYGSISGCTINSNYVRNFIAQSGTTNIIGNISGMNFGTITDCNANILEEMNVSGTSSYLVFGGLVGLNTDNASITYSNVSMSSGSLSTTVGAANSVILGGLIGVNSGSTAKYLVMTSNSYANLIVQGTTLNHLAAGIAISDNSILAAAPTYTGMPFTLQASVDGTTSKVGSIIMDYTGRIAYNGNNNYIGVVFARASQYASTKKTLDGAQEYAIYNSIITTSEYVNDSTTYNVGNDSYSSSEGSLFSGYPIMGYVDAFSTAIGKNIRTGAQIDTSHNSRFSWARGASEGSIIVECTDYVFYVDYIQISYIDVAETNILTLSSKEEVVDYEGFTYNLGSGAYPTSTSRIVTIEKALMDTFTRRADLSTRDTVGEYIVHIEFFEPIVVINDVFQLAQFMWYDSSYSEDNINNYYTSTYLTGKVATNKDNGNTMLLSEIGKTGIEYDAATNFAYWSANKAKLGNDIVLDEYVFNGVTYNVDLGWGSQVWYTFAAGKILDGAGYQITLITDNFNNSARNEVVTTSEWYSTTQYIRPSAWNKTDWVPPVYAVSLSDAADTPGYLPNQKNTDRNLVYVMGGFVGVQRGTIKNVDFVYREGCQLNVANADLSTVQLTGTLFVGVVSGYSTGITDSCSLVMEESSQVYVAKQGDKRMNGTLNVWWGVDEAEYYTTLVGGYTGMLGHDATISNCSLDMRANTTIGAQQLGFHTNGLDTTNGWRFGDCCTLVGGFTGLMGANSMIYNAKISGDETSRIFAMTMNYNNDSNYYNTAANAAGGIVGCNSTNSTYNKKGIGTGTVNGVIFNWRGLAISCNQTDTGDRTTMYYNYSGGVCFGVVDSAKVSNFYYTFDIASFAQTAPGAGTNDRYVTIQNGDTVYNFNMMSSSKNVIYDNDVRLSNVKGSDYSALESSIKVFKVYELQDNTGYNVSGTGFTINSQTSTTTKADGTIVYSGATSTINSAYRIQYNLGDILSWNGTTINADIRVRFSADNADTAQIVWSIYLTNAIVSGRIVSDSAGTINFTPVYALATSIENAETYKTFDYVLSRGNGNNVSMYYCFGKAAKFMPDQNNYVQVKNDTTPNTYYGINPLMYNGVDDATSVALDVYDINNNALSYMPSSSKNSAVGKLGRTSSKLKGSSWTNTGELGEGEELTDSGQYKVEYALKASSINPYASPDDTSRTIFFPTVAVDAPIVGQTLETYTVYVAIIPIRLSITKIWKTYDGYTGVNYTGNGINNYSRISMTINTANIYKPSTYTYTQNTDRTLTVNASSSITGSSKKLELVLTGNYNSASVENANSINITLSTTDTITYWTVSGTVGDYSVNKANTIKSLYNTKAQFALTESDNSTVGTFVTFTNRMQTPDGAGTYSVYITTTQILDDSVVSFDTYEKIYDGMQILTSSEDIKTFVRVTGADEYGNLFTKDSFRYIVTSAPSNYNVGIYPNAFTVSIECNDSNYEMTTVNRTMSYAIIPKEITINSATKTYDGEKTITTSQRSISGTINNIAINFKVEYSDAKAATNCTLVVSYTEFIFNNHLYYRLVNNGGSTTGNGAATNYCFKQEAKTGLNSASGSARTYNLTNVNYRINKYVITAANDDFAFSINGSPLNSASFEYGANRTYSSADLAGTVTISNAATISNSNVLYNVFTKVNTTGTNTINVAYTFKKNNSAVTTIKDVGTYTVFASFSGNNYYSTSEISLGSFTITQQIVGYEQLSITMDSFSNVYGDNGFNKPTNFGATTIVITDKYQTDQTVVNAAYVSNAAYSSDGAATITANNGVYIGGYSVWATAISGTIDSNYTLSGVFTLSTLVPVNGEAVTYYIVPREMTMLNVLKTYNGDTSASVDTEYAIQNLYTGDVISVMDATYADSNIGVNKNVTFVTTSTSINGTSYNVLHSNYCLTNTTAAAGTIIPKEALVFNISKTYDGTNTLTYTGAHASNSFVQDKDFNVLDIKPTGSYLSANVGANAYVPTTQVFSYNLVNSVDNSFGTADTKYILLDDGTPTNYCILNQNVPDIAYIIPLEVTINSVSKIYDQTNTMTKDNSTFDMTGTIDSTSYFDGTYSSADVKYSSGKYNDAIMDVVSYSYYVPNGSQLQSHVVYRLLKDNQPTNYSLVGSNINNTITLAGIGAIIPYTAVITDIQKEYDRGTSFTTTFSETATDYAIVTTIDGSKDTRSYQFEITGTTASKDASQAKIRATINCINFVFNGTTYNWLYTSGNPNNKANNYCIANNIINNVATIYKFSISLDPNSQTSRDGYLSALRFETSKGTFIVKDGGTYYSSVIYSISNFAATFTYGGQTSVLSNGSITIESQVISFNLLMSGSTASMQDQGTYSLTLQMVSNGSTNYEFDGGSSAFTFTIKPQEISTTNAKAMLSDLTKEYDGTATTNNYTMNSITYSAVDADNNSISFTTSGTVNFASQPASANVGSYDLGINITSSSFTINTNYKLVGSTISNVYSSGTTPTKFVIVPKQLSIPSNYVKEFDGTSYIAVNGVANEIVYIGLDFNDVTKGTLVGEYTGSATPTVRNVNSLMNEDNKELSIPENYSVDSSISMTLSITKSNNLVVERTPYEINNGTNANKFVLSIALSGLQGFEFLKAVNPDLTDEILENAILYIQNPTENADKADALTQVKTSLTYLLMFNVNDTTDYTTNLLEADQFVNFNIYSAVSSTDVQTYTFEFTYNGASVLDSLTITDRYAAFIIGYNNTASALDTSYDYASTNVVVSSSELSDGQLDVNTYTKTGKAIATAADLIDFLKTGTGNGYLTANIYDVDMSLKEDEEGTTFASGRTLFGNGYTVQLTGGFNTFGSYNGLFVAINGGIIRDISFKIATNSGIVGSDTTYTGLVVGWNSGSMINCSIDLNSTLTYAEDITSARIGGFAGRNSGTLSQVTVNFSQGVGLSNFGGIAYANTGSMNYVSVRVNKYVGSVTLASGSNAVLASGTYVVPFLINATSLSLGVTATTLYGTGTSNALSLVNPYTDGYIDYYFATSGKMIDRGAFHNEYNGESSANDNTTYYYNKTAATSYDVVLAMETLAPMGSFIWEVYDVVAAEASGVPTEYGVSLNRAVGLFNISLSTTNSIDRATFTFQTPGLTNYSAAIGIKAGIVVSSGSGEVVEREYTGESITVQFTAAVTSGLVTETKTLLVTGTEVGSYTNLFAQADGSNLGETFDVTNRVATILTDSTGRTTSVMLIVVPKNVTTSATIEKNYDGTTIAETMMTDLNSYIYGEFSSNGGENLDVSYYSNTKSVVAFVSNNRFARKLLNAEGYVFEPINIASDYFATTTNVVNGTYSLDQISHAYNQLIDWNDLTTEEKESGLYKEVSVYDLYITRQIDLESGEISYTAQDKIYYAMSLYNLEDDEFNRSYKFAITGHAYQFGNNGETTIVAANRVLNKVSSEGTINAITINAEFAEDKLNQSYRQQTINGLTAVANVDINSYTFPHTMTQEQIAAFETYLNGLSIENVSVDYSADAFSDYLVYDETVGGYKAKNQTFVKIPLASASGSGSTSDSNVNVTVQGSDLFLTLRWFKYDTTSSVYLIETFEDFMKIGSVDGASDYDMLAYSLTKNINGKSQVVEQFAWGGIPFTGSFNGNNHVVSNFVLIGATNASIFKTLDTTASVSNVTFANVVEILKSTTSTEAVVAEANNGNIANVQVEGRFVANGTTTVKGIATSGTGTTNNNTYLLQTQSDKFNVTLTGTTNKEVVIFRNYGTTSFSVYINNQVSAIANVADSVTALLTSYVVNKATFSISSGTATINNFRQYWAFVNLCPWLTASHIYSLGIY